MSGYEQYKILAENAKPIKEVDLELKEIDILYYFKQFININNVGKISGVYLAPVKKTISARMINWPLKNGSSVIFIDEEFYNTDKNICLTLITHEILHGLFNTMNGIPYSFGQRLDINNEQEHLRYTGINEACTQMFTEDIENIRLSRSEDAILYDLKNIMRVMKILYGNDVIVSQYVNNTSCFKDVLNNKSPFYQFDELATDMNDIYNYEKKVKDRTITKVESEYLNNKKEQIFNYLSEQINLCQQENQSIIDEIITEVCDDDIIAKLNILKRKK